MTHEAGAANDDAPAGSEHREAGIFAAYVVASMVVGADEVRVPIGLARSVAALLGQPLGALLDG